MCTFKISYKRKKISPEPSFNSYLIHAEDIKELKSIYEMFDIRGFKRTKTSHGYNFEACPSYRGCTLVLYGRDASAVKNSFKVPLALISIQSKQIHNQYEPVEGKIETEKKMERYVYVFDEKEANLEMVYSNLLPIGSGDMMFKFRLEPNTTGCDDALLNEITVLHAGHSYTMSSSALGPDPEKFTTIRIETKDSLLRSMGITTQEKLTNVDKYKNIKQQIICDVIPDESISKYFACGLDLSIQDNFFVPCCHRQRWFDRPIQSKYNGPYFKDGLNRWESQYESDGSQYDEVDGRHPSSVPKNRQHLAEVTAGEKKKKPMSIPVVFKADNLLALSSIYITLTGTDKSCSCMDYAPE